MPTPLAHAIGGLAAGRLVDSRPGLGWAGLALFALVFANLPDLDFLPGLVVGEPRIHHRGPSHSLGATVLVGVAAGAFTAWRGWGFRRGFLLAGAVYGSHLLLDGVTPDTHGLTGIPLLWPLSDELMGKAIPLPAALQDFLHLRLGTDSRSFFASLFSLRAAAVMLAEALLVAPLLALSALAERLGRRRGQGKMPRVS